MKKEEKMLKNEQINQLTKTLRETKTKTIHELGKIGRKHPLIKYPIFAGTVVFVFLYNLFLHLFIQWKLNEKLARAMAVAMTLVLVITSVDLTAMALDTEADRYYKVSQVGEVDTVDEIKDVNISGKAEVTVGQGAIIIESGDKGQVAAITGDLQTIIEAILTKDDMEAVQNGSTVVIRLNVMPIEENKTVDSSMDDNQKELQEIKKVFPKYQKEIEGLTLVEGYDILVEKSIDGSKWQTVSELNDEVEITMLIPKELRKEGRTFFMLHNHEGEISILEDLDVDIDTITIKTVKFSAYVISSLILIIVLLSIAGYMIYKKKKNRNK